ncbi:MAG: T9SS type A sorting domain-containing protein [Lewinella sp.]
MKQFLLLLFFFTGSTTTTLFGQCPNNANACVGPTCCVAQTSAEFLACGAGTATQIFVDAGNSTLMVSGTPDLSGVQVCQGNSSLELPPATILDAGTSFDAGGNDGVSVTINGTTFSYTNNGSGATGTLAELNAAIASGATTLEEAISFLPVTLVSFQALISDKEVVLSWETAAESGNEAFLLDYSYDGEVFLPLLQVNSNGNSETISRYEAKDVPQQAGNIYYRLRQRDFSGSESILATRALVWEMAHDGTVSVYPNPVQQGTPVFMRGLVSTPGQPISLMDLNGRTLLTTPMTTDGQLNLPVNLKPGLYLIRANSKLLRIVVR